jgi:hypothetical protein
MELSPSQYATSCAATTYYLNNLSNLKIHYYFQERRPLDPTLSQTDPVRTNPSYLSQIYQKYFFHSKCQISYQYSVAKVIYQKNPFKSWALLNFS